MRTRVAVAVAACAVVATVLASAASACSCAGIENPRAALAAADGAFVGTIERKDDGVFHYRIEHAVKGVGGATVAVRSSFEGCGLEGQPGTRVALFLDRSPSGEWSSHLCKGIEPDRLLEATRPLPAPDGSGPPAWIVGNGLGDKRTMLLDTQGRTLGYGDGPVGEPGDIIDLDVCPGGRRVVEGLLSGGEGRDRPMLVVRAIDGLRIERTVTVGEVFDPSAHHWRVQEVQCRGPSAEVIDVVVADYGDAGNRTFLFRLADGRWRRVTQSGDTSLFISDDPKSAVVRNDDRFDRLDIDSGTTTTFFRSARAQSSALSSAGTSFAVVTMNPERYTPEKLVVVATADGAVQGSHDFTQDTDMADMAWADDRTLAVSGNYRAATLTFFDTALRVVGSVAGWQAHRLMATDGRVFGAPYGHAPLIEARRDWKTARELVRLPDGATYAIAAVPPPTRSATATTTTAVPTRAEAPVETVTPSPATMPEIPLPMAAPPPVAPASSTRPWAPAGAATVLLGAAVTAIALRHKSLSSQ